MRTDQAVKVLNRLLEEGFANKEAGKPVHDERKAIKLAIDVLNGVDIKELKVFTCTDHDSHYPVGVASIVVAPTEQTARNTLRKQLSEHGLNPDTDFTLYEVDITKRHATILCDGNY